MDLNEQLLFWKKPSSWVSLWMKPDGNFSMDLIRFVKGQHTTFLRSSKYFSKTASLLRAEDAWLGCLCRLSVTAFRHRNGDTHATSLKPFKRLYMQHILRHSSIQPHDRPLVTPYPDIKLRGPMPSPICSQWRMWGMHHHISISSANQSISNSEESWTTVALLYLSSELLFQIRFCLFIEMPKALILIADGSEEIEFVTPYDGTCI